MGRINVDNLEKDMLLNEDVKSGNQILLAKGVKITNKHINIFKSWGINSVDISGACEEELIKIKLNSLSPEERKNLEKNLKEKFLHVDMGFRPAKALFDGCLLNKIE